MEETIYQDLQTISHGRKNYTLENFKNLIHGALESTEFSQIVQALCKQLRLFVGLQQDVNEMRSDADVNAFLMDISSFLEELQCPYQQLVSVPLDERLATPENRLLLLDFLIGELQAARLNYLRHGPEQRSGSKELSPSSESLKQIIIALGLSAPPPDMDAARLFVRLEGKLKEKLAILPPNAFGQPLLTNTLNAEQWQQLELINDALCAEYRLRREMLLKRFDVTVQSFSWSEKAKAKEAELKQVYLPRRKEMTIDSRVTMADILAARDDLLHVEKTSSSSVRKFTQCSVNRFVMDDVPDRGGRTGEAILAGPEMPTFRPRVEGQAAAAAGFHGRGRVQHGYSRGRGDRGRRW